MNTKTKKILIRSIIGILGLVVAVIAVRTWQDGRAQKELDEAWGKLSQTKTLVSLRTLLPPVSKDEDNAARIWKAAENVFLLDAEGRAGLQRVEKAWLEGKKPDPASVAAVNALAVRNRLTFDLIRAAVAKPAFRYNLISESAYDRPWNWKIPDMIVLIQGLRLIGIEAALLAESGRTVEALDLWTTGTRLLLLMRRDLPFIGSRVLVGCMMRQITVLNRIVAGRDLDEKALTALLDLVRVEPWNEEFLFAIRFEAAAQSQLFWKLIEDPEGARDEARELSAQGLRGWLFRPTLKLAAAWSARNLEKVAGLAGRAPYEFDNYVAVVAGETSPPRPRSVRLFFGENGSDVIWPFTELTGFKLRFDLMTAWLTAARLGIAGRLHFLRHGAYPATLAELDRDIIGEPPVDAFTGRALVYKAGPNGFSVYSIGPNGRDEEGRCAGSLRPTGYRGADDDCVWTESRPLAREKSGR